MSVMVRAFVPGIPVPQGSLTSFVRKSGDKLWAQTTYGQGPAAQRLAIWRNAVSLHLREAMAEVEPQPGFPIGVMVFAADLTFFLPRPSSHFGTGRNRATLKASSPAFPNTTPDIDKLVRAILDAVTVSGLWEDDKQVVLLRATKRYATELSPVGCVITISEV